MSKSRLTLVAVMVAVLCAGPGSCIPEPGPGPGGGKAGVAVANDSTSAIVEFHVVASANKAADWGPNLLAAPILPGGQQTIAEVDAGDYDVLLATSDPGSKTDTNFDIYGVSLTGGINYEFGHTDQGPTLSSNQPPPPPVSADHFVGYWRGEYIPISGLPLGATCLQTSTYGNWCRRPHYIYLGPANAQGLRPRRTCSAPCGSGTCNPEGDWKYVGGGQITTGSGAPLYYYIDDDTIAFNAWGGSSFWTFDRVTCK